MDKSFDQRMNRYNGMAWLKDIFTPDRNRELGLLSYMGAEFEFPTCAALRWGVAEAAEKSLFGFTVAGDLYKARVCWWMKQARGCIIDSEWIVTTHGTIFSLATTIRMQTKPGENIIILIPGYNRYEQAAARLGRGTVKVPLHEEAGCFAMDWAALEAAMAVPENQVLVLCNPNNPTGHAYCQADLERIAALSAQYGVTVYADEIFADVTDGDSILPYAAVAGEAALAISCTGLGKTFSLTGVNHANVLIKNPALRERFISQRNADHYGSIDPLHAAALVSAYTPEGYAWLREMKAYIRENHRIFCERMKNLFPGVVITAMEGTYVVWADFAPAGLNGAQVEETIAGQGCFSGDPGPDYYGREACMRFSLAVPRAELIRSLDFLEETLKQM